jgi:hypothetical protein
VLNDTGLGNHPELVRFCCRVARAMAEDGVVRPETAGGSADPLEVLYPSMAKKN